jgi:putative transposase
VGAVELCKKIRIKPNAEQRQLLKQWFGTARRFYNDTVALLKQPDTKAQWIAIKTPMVQNSPEWAKDVPYEVKAQAVHDCCKAMSAVKRYNQKLKRIKKKDSKNTKNYAELHFRSKFHKQNIFIKKSALSKLGVYHTKLGQLEMTEKMPENPRDSRLILENNEYYLSVPYTKPQCVTPKPQSMAALDPGGRTFLSVYSVNSVTDIGTGAFSRIFRLCKVADHLTSRVAKKPRNRKSLDRARKRILCKIRNLIHELHHQTAAWLTQKFSHVAVPAFNFHECAWTKKLSAKTVRNLASFAHGRFRQVLLHHCNKRGVVFGTGSEAYTSKTDPFSGAINDIGGRKTLKLSNGGRYLRDNVGAFGIFLRALSDGTWVWQHTLQSAGCSNAV